MSPMSRFALFAVCFLVIVAIGTRPRHGASLSKAMNDMCVCMPARAELLLKAVVAKTHGTSAEPSTQIASSGR
jgi:hypothetical protein